MEIELMPSLELFVWKLFYVSVHLFTFSVLSSTAHSILLYAWLNIGSIKGISVSNHAKIVTSPLRGP